MNKKIIFRKCISTNKIVSTNEMIRIVRDKNNNFFLEQNNYIQGRGAYILNDLKTINHALERKLLNKTFKTNISNDVYDKLKKEVNEYGKIKNKEQ